jgi:hypothetical protein
MATIQSTKTTSSSTPAEIKMTVTRFKDVLASASSGTARGTGYEMKLSAEHPSVSIKGDVIYVKSPGAGLRFTMAAAPGDRESYYPIGIAFVRAGKGNTSDEQRLGFLNFAQRDTRPEGRSLAITYRYLDDPKDVRYKFSVVIQRGSDGRIGIIDPAIEHDNAGMR